MIGPATTVGTVVVVAVGAAVLFSFRRTSGWARTRLLWLASGVVATVTVGAVGWAMSVLLEWPAHPTAGFASACILLPTAFAVSRSERLRRLAEPALVRVVVVAGLVGLIGAVYLIVVVGLGRVPEGEERTILALSGAAAAIASVLAFPARKRLEGWANERVYGERSSPDQALHTFGGRMTRAVPMDELLLQLVETLKKSMRLTGAEIWTGPDGHLTRTVSVPERPPSEIRLSPEERQVVARAHAQGNAWLEVWVPALLEQRAGRLVRSVSVAHLGELLALIVVERATDATPFTEEEDRALVDLARQVGLALHNLRLDSALQASLDELQRRNEELIASRARIVAAADESRRAIERDLHDGAQQHLVALAINISLAESLLDSDAEAARTVLGQLRDDVRTTLAELRDLAHGIYPPLLRDRGLTEALRTAAARAALPTDVIADVGRYDQDVEAAIYFCCLEAMQNAAKHAGPNARMTLTLGSSNDSLWFEATDDGVGFQADTRSDSHGFVNMRDRLGAFGGRLEIQAAPGAGTTLRGLLPVAISDSAR